MAGLGDRALRLQRTAGARAAAPSPVQVITPSRRPRPVRPWGIACGASNRGCRARLQDAWPQLCTGGSAGAACAHAPHAHACCCASWVGLAGGSCRSRDRRRAAACAASAAPAPRRKLVCCRPSCNATRRLSVFRSRWRRPAAVVSGWPCRLAACAGRCVQGPHVAWLCGARARVSPGRSPRACGRGGANRCRRDA